MKRFFTRFSLLVLLCVSAQASTITGVLHSPFDAVQSNSVIRARFDMVATNQPWGESISFTYSRTFVCRNGVIPSVYCGQGVYQVTYGPQNNKLYIVVPDDTNTYDIAKLAYPYPVIFSANSPWATREFVLSNTPAIDTNAVNLAVSNAIVAIGGSFATMAQLAEANTNLLAQINAASNSIIALANNFAVTNLSDTLAKTNAILQAQLSGYLRVEAGNVNITSNMLLNVDGIADFNNFVNINGDLNAVGANEFGSVTVDGPVVLETNLTVNAATAIVAPVPGGTGPVLTLIGNNGASEGFDTQGNYSAYDPLGNQVQVTPTGVSLWPPSTNGGPQTPLLSLTTSNITIGIAVVPMPSDVTNIARNLASAIASLTNTAIQLQLMLVNIHDGNRSNDLRAATNMLMGNLTNLFATTGLIELNVGGTNLTVLGDSVALGYTPGGNITCFGQYIATRKNWYFTNFARGGSFAANDATNAYNLTPSTNNNYILSWGWNEAAHYPRSAQISNILPIVLAEAGWLGIADYKKQKPGSNNVVTTGFWTNTPVTSFGLMSTNTGSTITITNLYGVAILLAFQAWENGGATGSYRIDLDGSPYVTNSAQFMDVISQAGHTLTNAPYGILLTNLPVATHTVVITVLSGVVEFDWGAGNLLNAADLAGPNVYLCPTTIRPTDAIAASWDSSSLTAAARIAAVNSTYAACSFLLAQAGLNVLWCDLPGVIDPNDLWSDGTHPNQGGQSKIAMAVERGMNGLILPRDRQLAARTTWSLPDYSATNATLAIGTNKGSAPLTVATTNSAGTIASFKYAGGGADVVTIGGAVPFVVNGNSQFGNIYPGAVVLGAGSYLSVNSASDLNIGMPASTQTNIIFRGTNISFTNAYTVTAPNAYVGIGTNIPTSPLDIVGGPALNRSFQIFNRPGGAVVSWGDTNGNLNVPSLNATYQILANNNGTGAIVSLIVRNQSASSTGPAFQLLDFGSTVRVQGDTNGLWHIPTEAYFLTNLTQLAGTNFVMTTNIPSFLTIGTTASAPTVFLPTPTPTIAGMVFRVLDKAGTAATRSITVSATNVFGQSQTINGAVSYVISANYGFCHAMCDGTNFFIIGK